MGAVGVDSALAAKGMGRSLLHALEEILHHKGVDTIYSQADWHNLTMLKFFGRCGFSLAARHILERDATNLPDFEYAIDLIEESARLSDANDYSDAEGDQRGALVHDRVPCRSMRTSDLDAIAKIDHRRTGRDHRAYYEQKMKVMRFLEGSLMQMNRWPAVSALASLPTKPTPCSMLRRVALISTVPRSASYSKKPVNARNDAVITLPYHQDAKCRLLSSMRSNPSWIGRGKALGRESTEFDRSS